MDADAKARRGRIPTITADVVRLRGLLDPTRYANERGPGAVMSSAIALIILLVCTTTVSSLLIGGAVARRFEIGVRLALGASRARVIRQLLTEIAILSLAGGALGLWIFGILGKLTEVAQDGFDVSPDWRTTGFTLLYAMLTATLAGLSPALHATRSGLSDVLKDSSTGASRKSRAQRTFVIAQIAIAQPLMVILAAATANVLQQVPAPRDVHQRERLMVAEFDTRIATATNAPSMVPALQQRLAAIPGVEAVVPIGYGPERISLAPPPASSPGPASTRETERLPTTAEVFAVPPGYFAAINARVVRGRDFVASDTLATVTPVIVSSLLAAQLFEAADPIGRRVRLVARGDTPPPELEIVGVVAIDQEATTLGHPSDLPPLYAPHRRHVGRFLIRTTAPAEALIPTVRAVARVEARLLPMSAIGTLAEADRRVRVRRLEVFGSVAGFGMIVLLLASIGLYAMMSIAVAQRRREIGIRVALGAHHRQVIMMFFRSGVRVTMIGLALGLPISLAGLTIMATVMEIPWILLPQSAVFVTLGVVSVGALASWLPARRAASVDPTIALRAE